MTVFAILFGLFVVALASLVLFLIWTGHQTRSPKAIVFRALDKAYTGGLFRYDGLLFWEWPEAIAAHLIHTDCKGYTPEQLVPYVRAWVRKTGVGKL